MTPQLGDANQRTSDCISRHPAVRNPGWWDVQSMLNSPTEAARAPNGNLNVTRKGQTLALHASLDKNLY
jgi:hypothetical protein